jgi:hypothetical protein
MAPYAAWGFVVGIWDHQIHDRASGDFSRHGRYSKHETFSGFDFPRYADGSPLPRASNQHKHYESITGGPSFMYRLLKLYQQRQKQ